MLAFLGIHAVNEPHFNPCLTGSWKLCHLTRPHDFQGSGEQKPTRVGSRESLVLAGHFRGPHECDKHGLLTSHIQVLVQFMVDHRRHLSKTLPARTIWKFPHMRIALQAELPHVEKRETHVGAVSRLSLLRFEDPSWPWKKFYGLRSVFRSVESRRLAPIS